MSMPPSGSTASGPKWSTKHHAPTVLRRARGSDRRTVIEPTTDSRAAETSAVGGSTWLPACLSGGVSRALTGPLMAWNATRVTTREDGVERLRRWSDEHRGVPPAFGRMRCSFDSVSPGEVAVRLPLSDELLLPDGSPTGATTAMLADFGLAACVISTLPDLRGVTTVSLTVDHLALPPRSGGLVIRCRATPYDGGGLQSARADVLDDAGGLVAHVSGWLMPTPAEPSGMERVGLVEEPAAVDVVDLLQVPFAPQFELVARDALSNAIGSLHGGIGGLACSLAAQAALPAMRPLTTTLAFLRPTPKEGAVAVDARVVRQGRRTGAADVTIADGDGRLLVSARVVTGSTGGAG
jgi:uncharacterized protein (TIGR00369 family)